MSLRPARQILFLSNSRTVRRDARINGIERADVSPIWHTVCKFKCDLIVLCQLKGPIPSGAMQIMDASPVRKIRCHSCGQVVEWSLEDLVNLLGAVWPHCCGRSMTIEPDTDDSPMPDPEDAMRIDGPEPTDAARELSDKNSNLEQPEHEGDALGDFGETVVDNDGEVKPELLDD